jgi:hypothetical protein
MGFPSYPQMSALLQWALPGFKWTPKGNTVKYETADGYVTTVSLMPYLLEKYQVELVPTLGDEYNSSTPFSNFVSVFRQVAAAGAPWLFQDPRTGGIVTKPVSAMINVTAGAAQQGYGTTGDGSSKFFQLARTGDSGGSFSLVQAANPSAVYVNNVSVSFSTSVSGQIKFASAPANNAVLTWAGNDLKIVMFDEDFLDDMKWIAFGSYGGSATQIWQVGGIKWSEIHVPDVAAT